MDATSGDDPTPGSAAVTGMPEVDGEHAFQGRLVEAVAALLQRADSSADERDQAIGQLIDFTSVHFLSEELLMRLRAFPQYSAHALEHAHLMDRVRALLSQRAAGSATANQAIVDELREWLAAHLRGPDQAFATWCARGGVTPG